MEKQEVLRVDEAAKLLRLSLSGAYTAIREGKIPHVRIGRRVLIPRAAIEQFLAGAKVG